MEHVICYFFIFLVEATILWQYASHLFVVKKKPTTALIVLCGLYLLLFAVSLLESKWLNAIFYFSVNFIFLATQCHLSWYSAFFHSSILTAVMMLCELMAYYVITGFMPDFLGKAGYHNLTIFAICSKLIFFTIISVLLHLHFLKKQRDGDRQYDKTQFFLMVVPVTSVFVMFTFIRISDSCALSPVLNWMIALSAAFLQTINLLVFGYNQYNQKKNLKFTEMQLQLQKEQDRAQYYEMLLSQNENKSILIHDMKKHLQSLYMMNRSGERDKINNYIQQLMQSSDLREVSRLCDNEMLNMILSRYQRQCMDRHIAFQADIRKGTVDFVSDADMTSLFCNLLDNAVEAAACFPDSFIELNISRREKTPFTVITVINSSRLNPFSGQADGLSIRKPDKSGHGFGIKSIRKTVDKYQGDMQMYYDDDSLTFHTIIMLKRPA